MWLKLALMSTGFNRKSSAAIFNLASMIPERNERPIFDKVLNKSAKALCFWFNMLLANDFCLALGKLVST